VSCPSASIYARYLAGELSRDESRPVETHLIQCRRCRELVLALRERGSAPDAPGRGGVGERAGGQPPTSQRSRALALPLTLVALAGVVATATALLETGLPPAPTGGDLSDGGWKRSYAMAIDLVFVLLRRRRGFRTRARPVRNGGARITGAPVERRLNFPLK
jgi:hypothetical protein